MKERVLGCSHTEYEHWEIKQPAIRPPTRLYHLKPISMDSPFRESLSGYLARLAEAHCVSVSTLYWQEISRYNSNLYIFGNKNKKKGRAYAPHEINGTGAIIKGLVKGLQKQTQVDGLERLTLLHWSEAFQDDELLRRYQSWCPYCYQQWRRKGEPLYYPLQWALQVVTGCVKHERRLSFACPYCNQRMPYLIKRARLGYCCWCEKWLGVDENDSLHFNKALSLGEVRWERWVFDNVGKLFSTRLPLRAEAFVRLFREGYCKAIARVLKGDKSYFAYLIRESLAKVHRLNNARQLPRPRILLIICYCLGVSLIDLLCGRLPYQFLIKK